MICTANNIKGITVEIGGNTGPLSTALKGVNKTAGDLQSELREVNKQLKFDPGNVTLLNQKQDLLAQSTEALKQKEAALKEAVEQAHAQFEQGDLGADKVRAVERELEKVSSQLKTAETQEKETADSLSGWKSAFSKLSAQSQSVTSSIGGHFGNLKSTVVGFATGLVASLSLDSLISAASSAAKTTAQMEAVLKSTGGAAGMTAKQLTDLAASQAKVTTYSAGTTKAAENMLLTFTNIKSNVFPQTVKATEDMATAMHLNATDAAKTLGKALNDPAAGLTKLTKQGVTFTDAQKEQIKAMQKAGDTAGAQTIILQELEKEFGGSAEAAGKTLPGQIQIMTNSLKSSGTTILTALMPIVTNIMPSIVKGAQELAAAVTAHKAEIVGAVQAISDVVKAAFDFVETHGALVKGVVIGVAGAFAAYKAAVLAANIVQGISNALTVASAIATNGLAAGKEALAAATGATTAATLVQSTATVAHTVSLGAHAVATAASSAAQWVLNSAFLACPITWIVLGIAAIIAAVVLMVTHWQQVSAFFVGLWDGIKTVFSNAWNFLNTGMGQWVTVILAVVAPFLGIPLLIAEHWGQISAFFVNLWDGIKTNLSNAWNTISTVLMSIITPLIAGITSAWDGVKTGITTIMTGLKTILSAAWDAIKTVVMTPVLLICDLVTGNFTKLKEDAGKAFHKLAEDLQAIWKGITQVATGAWQALSAVLTGLWDGLTGSAKAIWGALIGFFSGLWDSITCLFKSTWDALTSLVTNAWNGIAKVLNNPSLIFDAIKNGFSTAISYITSLPGEAVQWGEDFINGIANGIKNAMGAVTGAVNNVANQIRSVLHFSVPDAGPLVDYESWMPDFMGGLAAGINANTGTVAAAAKNAASAISSNMQVSAAISAVNTGTSQQGVSQNQKTSTASQSGAQTPVFNQYNEYHSPKALSPAEAARQTRNATRGLISAMKG